MPNNSTPTLSPAHARYLKDRGLDPEGEVALARGYRSATTRADLERAGFKGEKAGNVPALVIRLHPLHRDRLVRDHQIRPDKPLDDGRKFLRPWKAPNVIDANPLIHERVKDANEDLWITEGSVKADAAAACGLVCVSLSGVDSWVGKRTPDAKKTEPLEDWDVIPLDGRTVWICYDADVMTKPDVKVACGKLAGFLKELGANAGYVLLPEGPNGEKGWGLDDFLAHAGSVEGLEQYKTQELVAPSFYEDNVYVSSLDRFAHVERPRVLMTAQHFNRENVREAAGKQQPDRMLLGKEESKVQTPTYLPHPRPSDVCGRHRVWDTPPGYTEPVECLNLWRPPLIEPEQGDPSALVDHLRYLLNGDETAVHNVLSWFHFTVRGIKQHRALLLYGARQGTGKSLLREQVLKPLCGPQNVKMATTADVKRDFNDYLADAAVVWVEELMALGRKEIADTMKLLTTEPTITINPKGVKPYEIHNRFNVAASSNHEDALYIDSYSERRWLIYHCVEKRQPPEYYATLVKELRENLPAIYYHLWHYNPEGYNPYAPPPMTDGKRKMIEASRKDWEAWVIDCCQDRTGPFRDKAFVSAEDVFQAIPEALYHGQRDKPSVRKVGRLLARHLPLACENKDGGRVRVKVHGEEYKRALYRVSEDERWIGAREAQVAAEYSGEPPPF